MSNLPKVLFALHMPPPVHGAAMVGKYIHDSKIVNDAFECRFINIATASNLEDIGKLSKRKLTYVFSLIRKLKQTIAEFRPDIIYYTPNATGMPFYKDFLVLESLKKTGCKIVVHYHNKGVCTRQDRWFDNFLYKRFFKNLKVILLAENLYNDIKKYVKRDDVQICGNGIPKIHPSLSKGNLINNEHSHVKLLYLSNMMAEKGVWTLVDACRLLHDKGVRFECHFVGGWKDITENTFRNCIESYGLQDCVFAHGPKYGDEKEQYFDNADVMVFPTYYHNECFPLVLLEGMMHGLACISTNEAGIPGIIDDGKTGIMVTRHDFSQLADAIEKLAQDRNLCEQMGEAGRRKYEEQFTLSVFENRLKECLTSILNNLV